jgi:hypothetical protein
VGLLVSGPSFLGDVYQKPMAVSYAKARTILSTYTSVRASFTLLIRTLAINNLKAVSCPHCKGTGIEHTLVFGDPVPTPPGP